MLTLLGPYPQTSVMSLIVGAVGLGVRMRLVWFFDYRFEIGDPRGFDRRVPLFVAKALCALFPRKPWDYSVNYPECF